MGGCSASRLAGGGGGDEDDPVALCRDRKRLLKSAVDRRAALASAHAAYLLSLRSVAAALDLFVARHSAPAPLLIALPTSPPPSSSSPRKAAPLPSSHPSSPSDSSCGDEREATEAGDAEEEGEASGEMGGGYFFPPAAPEEVEAFGWDFFNPFDGVRAAEEAAAMAAGLGRSSDDDLRAVREEEGIPELEEDEEEVVEGREEEGERRKVVVLGVEGKEVEIGNGGESEGGKEEEKGLTVTETPARGRELLEALRDVEDHFIRAYDSGKEVSRMLEASMDRLESGLDESKDNPSKVVQAIAWHQSPSSQSSCYSSYLASSSNSISWTECKSDLFDDCGGMESGSHSQTLGRLYAWEKKLFEEVKTGDRTRQAYEKKCIQLRSQDAKGADARSVDKTRTVVRDLYTRIWVTIRAAESISKKIQKLRDEELQPQLIELLQGLMRTWKVMLESHDTQKQIMWEVKSFTCPAYGKFSNDLQRHASLKLEAELRNWRACFIGYIAAQKAYVEALDGWLSKFFVSDVVCYSRGRSSVPSFTAGAPPLVLICHDWLAALKKLPDKGVTSAMKCFIKDVRVLWVKQGEEQQQKRKVDSLAKDLDRRLLAFQRAEKKVLEAKLSDHKPEPDVRQRAEYLAGRKDLLEMFRKKLEAEKAKHHDCMQDTYEVTLNGFKLGFAGIFDSLMEFSKDSLNLYNELLKHNEKTKAANEVVGEPSCIKGAEARMETDSR